MPGIVAIWCPSAQLHAEVCSQKGGKSELKYELTWYMLHDSKVS